MISTHTLSPRIFIDMICKEVKVGVYFVGIQPVQTGLGEGMSAPVSEAVERLCKILEGIFPVL